MPTATSQTDHEIIAWDRANANRFKLKRLYRAANTAHPSIASGRPSSLTQISAIAERMASLRPSSPTHNCPARGWDRLKTERGL